MLRRLCAVLRIHLYKYTHTQCLSGLTCIIISIPWVGLKCVGGAFPGSVQSLSLSCAAASSLHLLPQSTRETSCCTQGRIGSGTHDCLRSHLLMSHAMGVWPFRQWLCPNLNPRLSPHMQSYLWTCDFACRKRLTVSIQTHSHIITHTWHCIYIIHIYTCIPTVFREYLIQDTPKWGHLN